MSLTPTHTASPLDSTGMEANTTDSGSTAHRNPDATLPSAATAARGGKDGTGILITPAALKQLGVLRRQQADDFLLRVGVRSGGCSGMSYTMDFIQPQDVRADDEVYTYELEGGAGFQVVSDPKSLLYIYGLQLDFSTALIGGGFNFTNPNATQTCGCGSSFAV